MSKEHEHNFVAETYEVQELSNVYVGNKRYASEILKHQRVLLFCTKCGEKIEATPDQSDMEKK